MSEQWAVINKQRVFRLQRDGTLEPSTGWQLKCPKGHPLHVVADFDKLDATISVGCEKCEAPYLVEL